MRKAQEREVALATTQAALESGAVEPGPLLRFLGEQAEKDKQSEKGKKKKRKKRHQ